MKNLKLLISIMVLSLVLATGCAKKDEQTSTQEETVNVTEEGSEETDTEAEIPEETENEEPAEEPTETAEAEEPTESVNILERGNWIENTYTNEKIGLSFEMPESWIKMSEEQIAQMMGEGLAAVDETGLDTSNVETGSVYDMVVTNSTTGSNVVIMMEDLNKTIGKPETTVDEYSETLKSQLQMALGEDVVFTDITDINLGSTAMKTLSFSTEAVAQHYYFNKIDDNMVSVIITIMGTDKVEDVVSSFK